MDFLKDLLQIQHELTLKQVSEKVLQDNVDKEQFIQKYNKRNYCMVKQCNCNMKCVIIDDLIYKLDCDHNHSLSR
jgi:hypothetical protein